MDELNGRIAVIGWGSLIWDLDDLAPKVEGPWLMRAGPSLPFEFSRISPKRQNALALCLDPEHGAPCPTNAILSMRADIHQAAEDLRARERAREIGFIGAFCARTGFHRSRLPEITPVFAEWCEATGAAGAVWTDLDSNFTGMNGSDYSIAAAIAYLRTLEGASLDEAVRYIERAPETTETPLRSALRADTWWRQEVARRSAAG
ncbi:hypothetical protein G5B40_13715 [Pikeienuella piscinae]|uniref:Uncharacterized protein n=1 Tax=Pikeienuella piscinae TaxID=2748098 RepID=A0A7L5C2J7_9RHOB|nr:hypothetical protein [Pikeienuella piscinae]QIE56424.1 hypothetical protein G5B40_13715 [Pikeienuella piscinae]